MSSLNARGGRGEGGGFGDFTLKKAQQTFARLDDAGDTLASRVVTTVTSTVTSGAHISWRAVLVRKVNLHHETQKERERGVRTRGGASKHPRKNAQSSLNAKGGWGVGFGVFTLKKYVPCSNKQKIIPVKTFFDCSSCCKVFTFVVFRQLDHLRS